MEPKVVECKCGKFIGVRTDDGYLIGNLLFKDFHAVCPNCNEKWHCYKISEKDATPPKSFPTDNLENFK